MATANTIGGGNVPMNPYQQWLGWSGGSDPNYYELLEVARDETDPQKLAAAADKAIARVRAHRPGEYAAQWAALLDELSQIRATLLYSTAPAHYFIPF